ncbi:MAG: hypothetical protein NTV88_00150 [Candidatus Micrarchaeota archaeon]|nr:hypothetical protein [Candidatus Micrarchaeota archaeon]
MLQPKAGGTRGGTQEKIVATESPTDFRILLSGALCSRFSTIKLMNENEFSRLLPSKAPNGFAAAIDKYNKPGTGSLDGLFGRIEKKTGLSRINLEKAIRAQNHIKKQDTYSTTSMKDLDIAVANLNPSVSRKKLGTYIRQLSAAKENQWVETEKLPVAFFISVKYTGGTDGTVTLYSKGIDAPLLYNSDYEYEINALDYCKDCTVKIPNNTPSLIILGSAQSILQLQEPIAQMMLETMNLNANW